MDKIKSIVLFLLIIIIFNDTLVSSILSLTLMRSIYALFLIIFSLDIINNFRSLKGLVKISILSFILLLVISSFVHFISIPSYPYENIYNMIIIGGILLAISQNNNNEIKRYMLFSIVLSCIYAILREDTLTEWTFRKTGGTGDPNEFACHIILGSIIAWNYIKNKILKLFLIFLFIFSLIISGSVTGGLCYVLMVIYKVVSVFKNKFNVKSLSVFFGLNIVIYTVLIRLDILNLYLDRALNNTSNFISRQNAWYNGLQLFRENWYTFFIGGGPNYFDQRNSLLVSSNDDTAIAAHSMYIEIMADTGIIGILLFLFPVSFLVFKNIFNPKYDMFFAMLFMSLALSMTYEKYFWLILALIL